MESASENKSAFDVWRDAGGTLGASVSVRKDKPVLYPYMLADARPEGFRGSAFLYLLFIMGLCVAGPLWLNSALSSQSSAALATQTANAIYSSSLLSAPVGFATDIAPIAEGSTLVAAVSSPAPLPTSSPTSSPTPSPSPSPTVAGRYEIVSFQRWYPDNPADCKEWDYVAGACVSVMATGKDWRESRFLGWAAACPEKWLRRDLWVSGAGYRCLDYGPRWVCRDGVCNVGILSIEDFEPFSEAVYVVGAQE